MAGAGPSIPRARGYGWRMLGPFSLRPPLLKQKTCEREVSEWITRPEEHTDMSWRAHNVDTTRLCTIQGAHVGRFAGAPREPPHLPAHEVCTRTLYCSTRQRCLPLCASFHDL